MPAPSPESFENRATDIGALAKLVSFDYGWLHGSAFGRGRTGASDLGSRQRHGDHADLSDLFDDGDPRNNIPESVMVFVRNKVESAAEHESKALHELKEAAKDLKSAFVRIDASHPGAKDRFEKVIERPDNGERKVLEAAQRRREDRRTSGVFGAAEESGR